MGSARKRRKVFREWRKKVAYSVVPGISAFGRMLIRSLFKTMRVRLQGEEPVIRMLESGEPFLMAFFHGRQLLLVPGMEGYRAAIMASISFLGEVQTGILEGFGYKVIRGSSSRGGARVLGEMIRYLRKGGIGALAVDGPRGPGQIVKPGIIFTARKLGVPIIPVSTSARPALLFKSAWDRYLLPLPFSRGLILLGSPWHPGEGSDSLDVEVQCDNLGRILMELEARADALIGRTAK